MSESVLSALRQYGEAHYEFPFLPHDDEPSISIRTAPEEPEDEEFAADQELALAVMEDFLDNEESICHDMILTLVKYLEIESARDEQWFQNFIDEVSEEAVRDAIALTEVCFVNLPDHDVALMGFAFECEWDPEHGLGVALHRRQVVEIGSHESLFSPEGMLPIELRNEAWRELFGEAVAAHESAMRDLMSEMLAKRNRQLEKVAQDESCGRKVRELSRLLMEHSGLTARLVFDVPVHQATTVPEMPSLSAKSLEGLKHMVHLLPPEMRAALEGKQDPVQHTPVVEISVSLGDGGSMWNYAGEIRTAKLEEGPWPDVLSAVRRKWSDAKPRLESVEVSRQGKATESDEAVRTALVDALREFYSLES